MPRVQPGPVCPTKPGCKQSRHARLHPPQWPHEPMDSLSANSPSPANSVGLPVSGHTDRSRSECPWRFALIAIAAQGWAGNKEADSRMSRCRQRSISLRIGLTQMQTTETQAKLSQPFDAYILREGHALWDAPRWCRFVRRWEPKTPVRIAVQSRINQVFIFFCTPRGTMVP